MTYDPADFRTSWCSIAAGCLIWAVLLAGIAARDVAPRFGPGERAGSVTVTSKREHFREAGAKSAPVLCASLGRSS
jgi:hypothetical protein